MLFLQAVLISQLPCLSSASSPSVQTSWVLKLPGAAPRHAFGTRTHTHTHTYHTHTHTYTHTHINTHTHNTRAHRRMHWACEHRSYSRYIWIYTYTHVHPSLPLSFSLSLSRSLSLPLSLLRWHVRGVWFSAVVVSGSIAAGSSSASTRPPYLEIIERCFKGCEGSWMFLRQFLPPKNTVWNNSKLRQYTRASSFHNTQASVASIDPISLSFCIVCFCIALRFVHPWQRRRQTHPRNQHHPSAFAPGRCCCGR